MYDGTVPISSASVVVAPVGLYDPSNETNGFTRAFLCDSANHAESILDYIREEFDQLPGESELRDVLLHVAECIEDIVQDLNFILHQRILLRPAERYTVLSGVADKMDRILDKVFTIMDVLRPGEQDVNASGVSASTQFGNVNVTMGSA